MNTSGINVCLYMKTNEDKTMPTQNEVMDMVNRNVLVNVSTLINTLCQDGRYRDSLLSILSQPDYESAAFDEGFRVKEREDGFWLTWNELGIEKTEPGAYLSASDAWTDACDDASIEPYTNEAYEHWIVSDWLARELDKRGEMIEWDFLDMIIWGRAATGQSIHLDGVMVDIVDKK